MSNRPSKTSKKCCGQEAEKKPKPKPKPVKALPPAKPVECKPIEKPPKQPKLVEEPVCDKPKYYRTPEEQRAYLEQDVVPILMEGMLAVAREQPTDPISYLEKFWLQQQQACDIELPKNML